MDATQMSMNNIVECTPPLTARMWKDPNIVAVDFRNYAVVADGSTQTLATAASTDMEMNHDRA